MPVVVLAVILAVTCHSTHSRVFTVLAFGKVVVGAMSAALLKRPAAAASAVGSDVPQKHAADRLAPFLTDAATEVSKKRKLEETPNTTASSGISEKAVTLTQLDAVTPQEEEHAMEDCSMTAE